MLQITIGEKGQARPRLLRFEKVEVTIGRVVGNDVVLARDNVSQRHARLVVKDGRVIVVDLKSMNGTYVNGRKLTSPMVVRESDKIYVGDFILSVQIGEGAIRGAAVAPAAELVDPAEEAPPLQLGEGGADVPAGEEPAVVLPTEIARVEVFRRGALVSRRGTLEVPAGRTVVEVGGLPLGLLDDTVRAVVIEGELRVFDLHVALEIGAPAVGARVEEEEAVRELRRRIAGLDRRRQWLAEQVERLLALRPTLPPVPDSGDQPRFASEQPATAWLQLGTLARAEVERHQQELQQIDQQREELAEELGQAEERLGALSTEETRKLQVSKRLRMVLEGGDQPVAAQLELSYQVPGARWVPSYELRVDERATRAELRMSALVAQATGEDWRSVKLALSTADLRRSCELPELGAWRIGRRQAPRPQPGWRELPGDLDQLFADFDRGLLAVPGLAEGGESPTDEREITRRRPPPRPQARAMPAPPMAGFQQRAEEEDEEAPTQVAEDGPTGLHGATTAEYADASWEAGEVEALEEVADELAASEPPPPAAPAAASFASSRRAAAPAMLRAPGPGATPSPAGPQSIAPAADLLAYRSLALASPEEGRRGRLRPRRVDELLPPAWRDARGLAAVQQAQEELTYRLSQLDALELPRDACPVQRSAGHFAYRYRTSAPEIPADGQLHRIGVLRGELQVGLTYRTVPSVETAVFRLATLENELSQPLLAGPMDVFWGADFLVTSRMPTTAAGATIEAGLGVEPQIKVARNVRHSQQEKGLLGGRTVYDDRIEIEVASSLPHAVPVEVIERVPVTDERKIEVELVEESPRAEVYEQQERKHPIRGGRRFRLELGPGDKKQCTLRYTVALPAGNEIVGGGRRA